MGVTVSILSILVSVQGLIIIAGIIGYDVATDSGFADLFHKSPAQPKQEEFQPLAFEWEGHSFKCEEWGHAGRDVWCPNPDCPSNDISDDPTEEIEISEEWVMVGPE